MASSTALWFMGFIVRPANLTGSCPPNRESGEASEMATLLKPDPTFYPSARTAAEAQPEELARKANYSRPHTSHCGPDGIYMSALGAPDGGGPGGLFVLDHETFEVKGPWEKDRGVQELAYDFWWHLGQDILISSEWGM